MALTSLLHFLLPVFPPRDVVLVALAVVVVLGFASVSRYFDCHLIRPSLIDPGVQLVSIIPVPLMVGLAAVAVVGDGVAAVAGGDVTAAAAGDGADVGLVLRLMALIVSHLSPYSMTDPCVDQP